MGTRRGGGVSEVAAHLAEHRGAGQGPAELKEAPPVHPARGRALETFEDITRLWSSLTQWRM
jgi:hypothetical protein